MLMNLALLMFVVTENQHEPRRQINFSDSPIMANMRFVWEKPKTAKSSIG